MLGLSAVRQGSNAYPKAQFAARKRIRAAARFSSRDNLWS